MYGRPADEVSVAYPVELTGVRRAGACAGGRVEEGLADCSFDGQHFSAYQEIKKS